MTMTTIAPLISAAPTTATMMIDHANNANNNNNDSQPKHDDTIIIPTTKTHHDEMIATSLSNTINTTHINTTNTNNATTTCNHNKSTATSTNNSSDLNRSVYYKDHLKTNNGNSKDDNNNNDDDHPIDRIDYREHGGPLLEYLWCHDNTSPSSQQQQSSTFQSLLKGQTLYLGSEYSIPDGRYIYHIPGHAEQVLRVDTITNICKLIGPKLYGKYKWLRGININNTIYGLPCRANTVLCIHIPTETITTLYIPYNETYDTNDLIKKEKECIWKYHGGQISPIDGMIYCIPQSASHVLQINPYNNTCHFVGPALPGLYKWYGGTLSHIDNALYGIPHNSKHILRILPMKKQKKIPHSTNENNNENNNIDENEYDVHVTLHGDLSDYGSNHNNNNNNNESLSSSRDHLWHGATSSNIDGTIVCVPANADSVLCIYPPKPTNDDNNDDNENNNNEPMIIQLGYGMIQNPGRHRNDQKYKYLGAVCNEKTGIIYCIPCAAEYVLEINTILQSVREIGINLYNYEYICQNKYQNGIYLSNSNVIIAIPLASQTILMIDCNNTNNNDNNEPIVTTWKLPKPYNTLAKWEGGIALPSLLTSSLSDSNSNRNVIYCVPNCHKAVLRIELSENYHNHHHNSNVNSNHSHHNDDNDVGHHQHNIQEHNNDPSSSQEQSHQHEHSQQQQESSQQQQQSQQEQSQQQGKNELNMTSALSTTLSTLSLTTSITTTSTLQNAIENHQQQQISTNSKKNDKYNNKAYNNINYDRNDYYDNCKTDESILYKSGIPTLRSSSHRVKFAPQARIYDPKPTANNKNSKKKNGNSNSIQVQQPICLPYDLCTVDIYHIRQIETYNALRDSLIQLLLQCDPTMIGYFKGTTKIDNNTNTSTDSIGVSHTNIIVNNESSLEPIRMQDNIIEDDNFNSVNGKIQSVEASEILAKDDHHDNNGVIHNSTYRFEDFIIPIKSTWRIANGGQCETAQELLSKTVASNVSFLNHFDHFVQNEVILYLKERYIRCHNTNNDNENGEAAHNNDDITVAFDENKKIKFYYQRPPTIRLQPGPAWSQVKPHNDAEYGHQNGELNFWMPFTDRTITGVDLYCETFKPILSQNDNVHQKDGNNNHDDVNNTNNDTYKAIPANIGEIISFHGSSCKHYVNTNKTCSTRVSIDFRIGIEGYYDPYWQMKGTSNDHNRFIYEY